jgi:hypothetical protein
MGRKTALAVVMSVMLCSLTAWAGKPNQKAKGNAPGLNGIWSTTLLSTSNGVFSDSLGTNYYDGIDGVQFYFGVNGRNVNLITYDTPRELDLKFDTGSTAWVNSKLPAEVVSTVTLFGVNYFGQFEAMAVGSTAQLQMDIEFKNGSSPLTYEVTYASIAAMRESESTWLITSASSDIPGDPGFTASDQAVLSAIKKHSQTVYGTVSMPVRFEVTLAQ